MKISGITLSIRLHKYYLEVLHLLHKKYGNVMMLNERISIGIIQTFFDNNDIEKESIIVDYKLGHINIAVNAHRDTLQIETRDFIQTEKGETYFIDTPIRKLTPIINRYLNDLIIELYLYK